MPIVTHPRAMQVSAFQVDALDPLILFCAPAKPIKSLVLMMLFIFISLESTDLSICAYISSCGC